MGKRNLSLVLVATLLCATATVAAAQAVRGTVTAINGNTITVKTDTGAESTITVGEGTRILRAVPGQQGVQPMQFKDIQVGDRVSAQAAPGAGGAMDASRLLVMARTDVASRQQQEQQAWARGTGGIVTAVDPGASTVTVSSMPGQNVTIHVTPQTSVRRYSQSSVKFADAQASTLAQIQKGDQLRARGSRSPDGKDFNADEIVSGAFRNIAGLVTAADAANNTITVNDVIGKKSITLKISGDSQMRKLPEQMAMMLARMAHSGDNVAPASSAPQQATPAAGTPAAGAGQGMRATGGFGGRAPDFNQMLNRTPAVTLAELQKGDAIMVVATEGSAEQAPTVITLVAGVDPILRAAPSGGAAAAILSSWNMSGAPAEP